MQVKGVDLHYKFAPSRNNSLNSEEAPLIVFIHGVRFQFEFEFF